MPPQLRAEPKGVSFRQTRAVGVMEVTVNVQGFEELKRVLSKVPQREFNISNWHRCACGHATRDEWFQRQGFTKCNSFSEAAAFFGISYTDAKGLFAGQPGHLVTPQDVIDHIDAFLASPPLAAGPTEADRHARRQAIIDELRAKANKAAQKVRQVATALAIVFF
jgi:hypothetical protein